MSNDAEIERAVLREIRWDSQLQSSDLRVRVEHGVVTLTGTVQGYGPSWAAREATLRVPGVAEVVNRITVMLRACEGVQTARISTSMGRS